MNSASPPSPRPLLLWLAVAIAAAHAPLIWLMHATGGPCPDGLCGFWESILIWMMCAFFTLLLSVLGWLRGERPRWLILLAMAALFGPGLVLMLKSAYV